MGQPKELRQFLFQFPRMGDPRRAVPLEVERKAIVPPQRNSLKARGKRGGGVREGGPGRLDKEVQLRRCHSQFHRRLPCSGLRLRCAAESNSPCLGKVGGEAELGIEFIAQERPNSPGEGLQGLDLGSRGVVGVGVGASRAPD